MLLGVVVAFVSWIAKETSDIEPAGGRLGRLRGRLSRSQNALGQGLLGILSAGDLDEDVDALCASLAQL